MEPFGEFSDDGNDLEDFQKITSNNLKNIEKKLTKIGYADGVIDGQESNLQESFNSGYRDGLHVAFHMEKFKYFYCHLNATESIKSDLQKEMYNYYKLNNAVPELKPPDEFVISEELKDISKKQLQHLENKMNELHRQIPITSNLLTIPACTNFQ